MTRISLVNNWRLLIKYLLEIEYFFQGNINEEEFVQIFVQIFDGEDTGKIKTELNKYSPYPSTYFNA